MALPVAWRDASRLGTGDKQDEISRCRLARSARDFKLSIGGQFQLVSRIRLVLAKQYRKRCLYQWRSFSPNRLRTARHVRP